MKRLFELGIVVATPGIIEAFQATGEGMTAFIQRHVTGDFGVLDADDIQANTEAIQHNLRILSAYLLKDDTKFWIITEADRSATTLLLPSEY